MWLSLIPSTALSFEFHPAHFRRHFLARRKPPCLWPLPRGVLRVSVVLFRWRRYSINVLQSLRSSPTLLCKCCIAGFPICCAFVAPRHADWRLSDGALPDDERRCGFLNVSRKGLGEVILVGREMITRLAQNRSERIPVCQSDSVKFARAIPDRHSSGHVGEGGSTWWHGSEQPDMRVTAELMGSSTTWLS